MSNYYRLHPLVILKKSISWSLSLSLILILDILRNPNDKSNWLLSISIFGILITIAVIFNTYRWLTFKYTINSTTLSVKSGIFLKREQIIPFSRIQSFHQETWFLFRPFKVVKLTVETASSGNKVESVILEVVPQSTYDLLERLRLGEKDSLNLDIKSLDQHSNSKSQYSVSLNDIIVFSLVDFDIISWILGLIAISYHFTGFINKYLDPFLNKVIARGLLIITSLIIIVAVFAILGSIIKNIF